MSSGAESARALRRALGGFATGVTVVTAAGGDGCGDGSADVHGMTANAFTSVSMDPPLVLVSIAGTARMNACIERGGRYGVSVLADDQASHARRFAGQPGPVEPVRFDRLHDVPLLAGALLQVACAVERAVPAGDHTLFLGRVLDTAVRPGKPLLFYGGEFRELVA